MLLEKLPLVSVTLIDCLMKYSVMIEPQGTLVLCTALFFNQCFCCWHHSTAPPEVSCCHVHNTCDAQICFADSVIQSVSYFLICSPINPQPQLPILFRFILSSNPKGLLKTRFIFLYEPRCFAKISSAATYTGLISASFTFAVFISVFTLARRWPRRSASHCRPPTKSLWCPAAAPRWEQPNLLERCWIS